jgi:hypothetical protein
MSVLNSFNITRVQDIKDSLVNKQAGDSVKYLTDKQSKKTQAQDLLKFFNRNFITVNGEVQLVRDKTSEDIVELQSNKDNNIKTITEASDEGSDDESLSEYLTSKGFLQDAENSEL